MKVVEVNKEEARSWVKRWLGAGHVVSNAVLEKKPFDQGRFRTCIGEDVAMRRLGRYEEGWVGTAGQADIWLATLFDELEEGGARCVIAEDDMSRPTDPAFIRSDIPSALIGERVLCWQDLHAGNGATAVRETMHIATGYPRNVFVVSRTAEELGLADRQQVPEEFLGQVTESLMAVIVSIFDDETYLVWTPDEQDSGD